MSSRVSVRSMSSVASAFGKILVAPRLGLGERAAADHRHVEAGRPIGVEMRRRNAAGADQRDPRPIVLAASAAGRAARAPRLRPRPRSSGCRRRGRASRSCARAATVRFVSAESTALSTIRWPTRQSAGSSGPVIGAPSSMRASMYSIGARRPGGSVSTGTGVCAGVFARLQRDVVVVVVARDGAVGADQHEAAFRLRLLRPGIGERAPARLEFRQPARDSGRR